MMPADHVLWNECKIEWAARGDAYDVAYRRFRTGGNKANKREQWEEWWHKAAEKPRSQRRGRVNGYGNRLLTFSPSVMEYAPLAIILPLAETC